MEVVYSVTVVPDVDIEAEFLAWLRDTHIAEVVGTGCFDGYRLYQVLVDNQQESATYNIQYLTTDMNRYFDYIQNHADAMRQKGKEKFGDKIHAFRTVLKGL